MNPIHNYEWFAHKHNCLHLELMHFMQRHACNTHPHNNNNVGLHTFVHGEKLDLKITLQLKGTKTWHLKKCAKTTMFNHLKLARG
jgi:hypothetical protein